MSCTLAVRAPPARSRPSEGAITAFGAAHCALTSMPGIDWYVTAVSIFHHGSGTTADPLTCAWKGGFSLQSSVTWGESTTKQVGRNGWVPAATPTAASGMTEAARRPTLTPPCRMTPRGRRAFTLTSTPLNTCRAPRSSARIHSLVFRPSFAGLMSANPHNDWPPPPGRRESTGVVTQ